MSKIKIEGRERFVLRGGRTKHARSGKLKRQGMDMVFAEPESIWPRLMTCSDGVRGGGGGGGGGDWLTAFSLG